MSNRQKFEQDLTTLLCRLTSDSSSEVENKLNMLKDWLIKLQKENVVKINHSVMELVCAKYLRITSYNVCYTKLLRMPMGNPPAKGLAKHIMSGVTFQFSQPNNFPVRPKLV